MTVFATDAGPPPPAQAAPDPGWDKPGGLGIKERRSFALWQVVVVGIVCLILGMIIGYSNKKTSSSSASAPQSRLTLPPQSGATETGPTTTLAGASGISAATTTTAPGGSSTTVAVSQVATVLMPATKGQGPMDLPSFGTAGPWSIGWAFDCAESPGGGAAFTITVIPASGPAASTPAVSESGGSNQGVATEPSTTGTQHLRVATGTACLWIVKVTGIAG